MSEKQSNNSFPIWLQIGGSLPTLNSKAFSKKDLKPSRKSIANFVLSVPLRGEEKHVKISKTPLLLKYLKNNWIWHNKNGTENCSSSVLSRKRRRTERNEDSSNSDGDDTPETSRFRRSEPSEEVEMRESENQEENATNSIISALNETAANEGKEVIIHHFRHDYLTKQLENEEENIPSTSNNLINLNTCMAAREIEEEEKVSKEKESGVE
ncbi:hypothetical protein Mgra_00003590 [Meloidogyne graminicola]|uniref:Uncharacterized protein n=1 Tax=Meloidogyne graminicola TaxID=189291 RepID=A0A8S9ZVK7_9BILA|nr:hypothetical protein Mgra_00003590 [Meloidogyne graminicola]